MSLIPLPLRGKYEKIKLNEKISGDIGLSGKTGVEGPSGPKGEKGLSGVKYVRWGRTSCGGDAQIVYIG